MDSATIVSLLSARHSKDVFISECKDGPTWFRSHSRIDAWAMARSWTRPKFTAHEIKVSRGDFLRDDKWTAYLSVCNELYFVCPPGLIAVGECPAECGLLWASKNGARLYTKKKAPYRNIEPPVDMLIYALMRAKDFNPSTLEPRDQAEQWREWLCTKDEKKQIGWNVSHKLRKLVETRITRVENENRILVGRMEGFASVREALKLAGIPEHSWQAGGKLVSTIRGIPDDEFKRLDNARSAMTNLLAHWSTIRNGGSPAAEPST